jgi:hypothetical protein
MDGGWNMGCIVKKGQVGREGGRKGGREGGREESRKQEGVETYRWCGTT